MVDAGTTLPSVVVSLAILVALSFLSKGEQSTGKDGERPLKDGAHTQVDWTRHSSSSQVEKESGGGSEVRAAKLGRTNGPEVKVVTFNQGTLDPSALEPLRFWPRGHTAVVIDGEVHSFEANWQCGDTEAAYKEKNDWRGAWVQVLDLPRSKAKRIQENFDQSCGTGAFLLTGVCTTSAGRLLQKVLADLEVTWAPIRLRKKLAESGYVEKTRRWHREVWAENVTRCVREKAGPQHRSAVRPSAETAKTARAECINQLGLREEDLSEDDLRGNGTVTRVLAGRDGLRRARGR